MQQLSRSTEHTTHIIHTTNLGLSKYGRSDATVLCQTEIIADELSNTKKSDQQQQCMVIEWKIWKKVKKWMVH